MPAKANICSVVAEVYNISKLTFGLNTLLNSVAKNLLPS